MWKQVIEAAHQGAKAFADGLDWVAVCSGYYKGPVQFVFDKSLAKEHVDQIIKNQGKLYSTELLTGNQLVVYNFII